MANPLSGFINNSPQGGNNISNMIKQFQQFKANFQGDPRQRVQDLLNSGEMSQDQLTQCVNTARQLQNIFH